MSRIANGALLRAAAVACFAVATASCVVAAEHPTRQLFHVNAQYRGPVTKDLNGLGDLVVEYATRQDGSFTIDLQADMRAPKKPAEARFRAQMAYRLKGNSVEVIATENKFSPSAEKHKDKILQNAPFIYLVRHLAYPLSPLSDVTYIVGGKPYRLHYARSRNRMETTVFDGNRWVGKFFLNAGPTDKPPFDYDKFRVSTRNDTVISFVCDRAHGTRVGSATAGDAGALDTGSGE